MACGLVGMTNRIKTDLIRIGVTSLVTDYDSYAHPLCDRTRGLLNDLLFDVYCVRNPVLKVKISIIAATCQRRSKQLVDIAVGQTITIEEKPDGIGAHIILLLGGLKGRLHCFAALSMCAERRRIV